MLATGSFEWLVTAVPRALGGDRRAASQAIGAIGAIGPAGTIGHSWPVARRYSHDEPRSHGFDRPAVPDPPTEPAAAAIPHLDSPSLEAPRIDWSTLASALFVSRFDGIRIVPSERVT